MLMNERIEKLILSGQVSEYDILKFNQNYLKHNSCNFIPSTIILKNSIDYIKYEITSKHYPEVITGVLSAEV